MPTLCDPWTVAVQAPLFSRQECWSGLPFPSPQDLSNPGAKPKSPALHVDSLLSEPPVKSTPQFSSPHKKTKKRQREFQLMGRSNMADYRK